MLNHGVSTGALFMLLGMIYDRRHTYDINEFGGLATPMPIYATFFTFIMLSSVGLPLLNGFIGEFMILSGAFQAKQLYGILAATGVIWSACYLLWMYQRVFQGEVTNPKNATLRDLDGREQVSLWPLAIAALVMGVAPMLWLHSISPSVTEALKTFNAPAQAQAVKGHGFSGAAEASEIQDLKGHGFSRAETASILGSAALQRRVPPVEGHGFSRAVNEPSDVGFSPGPRLKPPKMARVDGGLKSPASTAGPRSRTATAGLTPASTDGPKSRTATAELTPASTAGPKPPAATAGLTPASTSGPKSGATTAEVIAQ